MSITFGSVGDIIAVGQIAYALAQALKDSSGSGREYQGLVKELQTFDQALLQVVALWQNYENSPELEALGKTTKEAIEDWRDTLLAFRLKVDKKYGASLCTGGSGNWLKDASKKVAWLKEKEDVLELRRKLQSASDVLTLLILTAMGKSNRLDSTAQEVRVELVYSLLQESVKRAEEQMTQLKLMNEKLESQARTSNMILSTVKSGVTKLTQVHAISVDMRNDLSLLQSHILAQHATPRGLGTHWQQEPVTLEDALGFMVPIPLELVNSWEMFDLILAKRFEKHPGHIKVQHKEFVIEEGSSGKEVSRMTDWSMCFRPGQKVDMSVVFQERSADSNHCPRCKTRSELSSEVRIQCASCNMWFQRITEVEESDGNHDVPDIPRKHFRVPQRACGPVLSPADFKRVRMLRKLLIASHMMARGEMGKEVAKKKEHFKFEAPSLEPTSTSNPSPKSPNTFVPWSPRSASYLTKHRKTTSRTRTADEDGGSRFSGKPVIGTLLGAAAGAAFAYAMVRSESPEPRQQDTSSSFRQSPSPVTDDAQKSAGAKIIISPPDSEQNSSDDAHDEDTEVQRGQPLEHLAELQTAIRVIEQHRESSANQTAEEFVDANEGTGQESDGWSTVKPRKDFGEEDAERFNSRMGFDQHLHAPSPFNYSLFNFGGYSGTDENSTGSYDFLPPPSFDEPRPAKTGSILRRDQRQEREPEWMDQAAEDEPEWMDQAAEDEPEWMDQAAEDEPEWMDQAAEDESPMHTYEEFQDWKKRILAAEAKQRSEIQGPL
ncbi:uncharacterized protein K444DRAFT_625172 [Hyaloscypha bicolor E]|uniref:Ubiquitin-like domain-containing protein n=1 Tax=Hyaloscypha bicolor E TaxID=1095630 RepID=A0A2J6TRI1_9HELO|nr:uncharacterized protein K444DRAFT_625172 [Hyaloscypha bicolor E]PMD65619.1 hypothetical protein K444DRAFT_625172 [Hyaloscypha bicolor E]